MVVNLIFSTPWKYHWGKSNSWKQIENENFNHLKYLKEQYFDFKTILENKVPKLVDFLQFSDVINPLNFIYESKSYIEFIVIVEDEKNLLQMTLDSFYEMRKKIKKPITDHAKKLLFSKLDKLAKTEDEKIEIINQSILNSWQDVFPLRVQKTENTEQKGNSTQAYLDMYNHLKIQ